MGVSTVTLEGKEAHETLLNRQESEIRLLETMRKCLSLKVKHDKDYAAALSSVASQGQKIDKFEDMKESNVFKAWKVLMEELENLGKLFKSNAEIIEKDTLNKLNTMCAEKRKAKKHYQDEYNRLCQQFSSLSEEVIKKRNDYYRYLEDYRLLRSRFEKQYFESHFDIPRLNENSLRGITKKPTKHFILRAVTKIENNHIELFADTLVGHSGKKLEDVREKYQKACRKLHQVHNEYVLLIADAQETRRDFNSILLPYLLEQQQAISQNFMSTWQILLKELVQCWNVPATQFAECCNNAENAINNIKPAEEYKVLVNKQNGVHTSNENSDFIFDNSLVEDTTGKLLPNQLTVDNLTVEWVRKKMADLEVMLKECQTSLSSCDNCINKENSIVDLTVSELRSKERKLTRQIEVIKKALSEIGCEDLPNECDLDGSFDQSNEIQPLNRESLKRASLSSLNQNSASLTSQISIVDKLWKPFRRKSAPNSPELGSRSAIGGCNNNEQPSSGAVGGINIRSLTLNIESSSAMPLQISNKNVVCDFINSTNPISEYGLSSSVRLLVDEEWFHGVLPRDEVVRLLRLEGDFLVRETERNNEKQTVLSVLWSGRDKHFIVQTTPEGEFRFEGPAFPTVQELITFQYQNSLPVTNRSGAILKRPILRERWELNNDDVHLIQKIGKGNFGDVYKAVLLSTTEEVAVKTCRVTVPDEYKKKFLQEGRILKQYDHPNIVKFIGICVQKQPIMIVMELVPGGSLLSFLRKSSLTLSCHQLMLMCRDTAAGMCYLESKNCIHRDLAARNCLVGNENTVKISDFGMSREEEEYIVSDGMKQIPIKWTAPEALNFGKYTSLCDVWSYGVLVWEIFSKGDNPYPGLNNSEARNKIDLGYRMPAPEGTPKEMYQLMLNCWEYEPEKRPHFDKIYKMVDRYVAQLSV